MTFSLKLRPWIGSLVGAVLSLLLLWYVIDPNYEIDGVMRTLFIVASVLVGGLIEQLLRRNALTGGKE